MAAAARVVSLAASRNNQADRSQPRAKTPTMMKTNWSWARATKAVDNWAAAVTAMTMAMPLGRHCVSKAPTMGMRITPKNIRFSGLSSSPMMPTARLDQMIRKLVPTATTMPAR